MVSAIGNRESDKCAVCGSDCRKTNTYPEPEILHWVYECPRCGTYTTNADTDFIMDATDGWLGPFESRARANLSSWLREYFDRGKQFNFTKRSILTDDPDALGEQIQNLRTPYFHEKADKLLLALEEETYFPGADIHISKIDCGRWIARSWSLREEELFYILDFLENAQRIKLKQNGANDNDNYICIQPDGWAHLERLHTDRQSSQQSFVAMSFDKRFYDLYEKGIEPAIWAAGYEPLRIDREEHNDRIDDRIEMEIKRSQFVVADLTGNNPGAIYEAGYARGHGIPTIITRDASELKKDAPEANKPHFDIRQINTITWNDLSNDKGMRDFAERLKARIVNTCGKGEVKPSSEKLKKLKEIHPELMD